MSRTISLLHATFRRPSSPNEIKQAWLDSADDVSRVEYVFAMNADDDQTLMWTRGHLRVITPPARGRVTCVRNWNAAAGVASGDLFMVIADDLFPPAGWDTTLLDVVGTLDPSKLAFAIKVADSADDDGTLMRHPVVSREFYRRWGLFSDAYTGVYCDDDITRRAFWRAVILDGRSLALDHRHPGADPSIRPSESYGRVNHVAEYRCGWRQYELSWSQRHRAARIRLVGLPPNPSPDWYTLRLRRWRNAAAGTMDYWRRRLGYFRRRALARHGRSAT